MQKWHVPANLLIEQHDDGDIARIVIVPSESYAGYFGPGTVGPGDPEQDLWPNVQHALSVGMLGDLIDWEE